MMPLPSHRAPRSSRTSPHLVAPDRLEQLLSGRNGLVREIVDGVAGAVLERRPRYEVLLGARGSGKSHLASLVASRLSQDGRLADRAAVVFLDEEQHVCSLLDLLARVLMALPAGGTAPDPRARARSLKTSGGVAGEDLASSFLAEQLQDRTLILILENLDRVFEALGIDGRKRLRALLHEGSGWSIVATAQALGPPFHDRTEPFHRVFETRDIPAFNAEECQEMLSRLARVHEEPSLVAALSGGGGLTVVRAIHHVLSGNPRALACLFPHLRVHGLENLEESFENLADGLTPTYRERMGTRSPGQQAILEQLAESGHPVPVKELAEASYMAQTTAAGQLRYLAGDRLVRASTLGRERFYELSDPLWWLAQVVKSPEQNWRTFVRFLRYWCAWSQTGPAAWSVSDGESVGWEAMRALLTPGPAKVSPWEHTINGLILEAKQKGRTVEAVRLARLYYEGSPDPDSAATFLTILAETSDLEGVREFSELALQRFGALIARVPFLLELAHPGTFSAAFVGRLRDALAHTPEQAVDLRSVADVLLLRDDESPESTLWACARRIVQNGTVRVDPNLLVPGILAPLSRFVAADDVIAVAEKQSRRTSQDGYVWLDALWRLGREGEAIQNLELVSETLAGPIEKASFRRVFLAERMHGDVYLQTPKPLGSAELLTQLAGYLQLRDPPARSSGWLEAQLPILAEVASRDPGLAVHAAASLLHAGRLSEAAFLACYAPPVCPVWPAAGYATQGLYGPSARHTAFGALLLGMGVPMLREALPSYLPSEHVPLAAALVDLLQAPAPTPMVDRVSPLLVPVLIGWLARLSNDAALGVGTAARLRDFLGPSPSDDLVASLTTALWQVAFSASVLERPTEGIVTLFGVFRDVAPDRTPTDMIEAALSLHHDARPFARLASPQRDVFRKALARMGLKGRQILDDLPSPDP
jgi:hypothetical protein